MSRTDDADLARDINAAKSEIRGRREQMVAELEERLRELDTMSEAAEAGTADIRASQARLRQLLNERGGVAGVARAGRTTIGMSAPAGGPKPMAAQPTPMPQRLGMTPALAEAALTKATTSIDLRVIGLLSKARGKSERDEARLELALLLRTRRGLVREGELPNDTVLLQTLADGADEAGAVVSDLDAGGAARLKRLCDFVRELAGQLGAVGHPQPAAKELVQKARTALAQNDEKGAAVAVASAYAKVKDELDKKLPLAAPSWLDEAARL